MKRFKLMLKELCLILAAVLLLPVFAGCAGNNSDTQQEAQSSGQPSQSAPAEQPYKGKTLNVWLIKSFSEQANALLQERFEQFGDVNGADVNVEIYSSADINKKFSAALEAKALPDICMTQQVSAYPYINSDVFVPMNDLIDEVEKNTGEFIIKNLCYVDDKAFMIPFYNSIQMLFYRKDLLKQAGYDAPPATWSEFREIARAVTEKTGVYGAGIGCGVNDEDGEAVMNYMLWGNGGGIYKDGKINIENNQLLKGVLENYVGMYTDDKSIPESAISWDASGNNTGYLAGQVAMVINTTTIINSLDEPGMEDLKSNTGVAEIPAGTEGRYLPGSNVGFSVCKTEQTDMAFAALRSIYDINWYNRYTEKVVPVCGPVLKRSLEEPVWDDEVNAQIAESLQYKTNYWSHPNYELGALMTSTAVYNQKLLCQTMQSILTQNVSIDAALKELQKTVDKIAAEYK